MMFLNLRIVQKSKRKRLIIAGYQLGNLPVGVDPQRALNFSAFIGNDGDVVLIRSSTIAQK